MGLRHYSFKPERSISLGFAALLALFLGLGFWQIQRAEEKHALMAEHVQRERDEPLRLSGTETDSEGLRYRRVRVAGEYDPAHQFLLDNQIHEGRPGYQVLTPLLIEGSGMAVLVNRGWLPQGNDRTRLPDISIRTPQVRISGTVERFYRPGMRLQGAEIPGPGWPSMVQIPEPEPLAARLGYPVLSYQVLLEPSAEQGYVRAWREIRLDPEKNLGYALQWFLFAVVVTILYVRHGLRAGSRRISSH